MTSRISIESNNAKRDLSPNGESVKDWLNSLRRQKEVSSDEARTADEAVQTAANSRLELAKANGTAYSLAKVSGEQLMTIMRSLPDPESVKLEDESTDKFGRYVSHRQLYDVLGAKLDRAASDKMLVDSDTFELSVHSLLERREETSDTFDQASITDALDALGSTLSPEYGIRDESVIGHVGGVALAGATRR